MTTLIEPRLMVYTRKLCKEKGVAHAVEWLWSRIQTFDGIKEIILDELGECERKMHCDRLSTARLAVQELNCTILTNIQELFEQKLPQARKRAVIPKDIAPEVAALQRKELKRTTDRKHYQKKKGIEQVDELAYCKQIYRNYIIKKAEKYLQQELEESEESDSGDDVVISETTPSE